jgi:PAS domain S-box-containing protein
MTDTDPPASDPDPPTAVLDRMTDALFGLDTSWEFTYLNEGARRIVCRAAGEEYTTDELVGRNIWDLIPDAVGTRFETEYREAMRSQESSSFESYYEPLGVWFEVRVYPSSSGLSIYFQDITERRQRREELENRAATLREMHEVIADRDATFESQVGDLLTIGQRVLGTDFGTLSRVRDDQYVFEVVRAPDDSLQAGDVVDLSVTNCERVVLTEETLVLASVADEAPELTAKKGYEEWGISCYLGTPVVVDGETYGTFCFYDTEPRTEAFSDWEVTLVDLMGRWVSTALERQLVRERLDREYERVEKFASVVSHDLRNPLNVAEGWLEVAAEDCGDSDALDKVASSHDRMQTIIEDVLSLARAGDDVTDPTPVALDVVATDAWNQVTTGDATLSVTAPATVRADRSRLQRLFENLFRNAVEHGSTSSRTGSDADGDALTVTVGGLDGGFYVADDGVGIPPEKRDDILELGYTTTKGGTGIGLGIVVDIAAAHDWSVDVTEGSAGGARFEFTGVDTA